MGHNYIGQQAGTRCKHACARRRAPLPAETVAPVSATRSMERSMAAQSAAWSDAPKAFATVWQSDREQATRADLFSEKFRRMPTVNAEGLDRVGGGGVGGGSQRGVSLGRLQIDPRALGVRRRRAPEAPEKKVRSAASISAWIRSNSSIFDGSRCSASFAALRTYVVMVLCSYGPM